MKNYYMWYIVYMKWKIIIHDNVSYSWNEETLHMIIYHIDELKKYYILYYIVYMK